MGGHNCKSHFDKYDKKRIEIVFSFDDVLMKAIEKYQKGVKEA